MSDSDHSWYKKYIPGPANPVNQDQTGSGASRKSLKDKPSKVKESKKNPKKTVSYPDGNKRDADIDKKDI